MPPAAGVRPDAAQGDAVKPLAPLTPEQQALCVQWLPMARKYARKTLRLAHMADSPEADGIANEALVRAARVWEPKRGPFKACLIPWVRAMVSLHKTTQAQVVARRQDDFSGDLLVNWLDAPLPSGRGTFADLLDDGEEPQTDGLDMARIARAVEHVILKALSGRRDPHLSLSVWKAMTFEEDATLTEVGSRHGFTRQAADRHFRLAQAAVDRWAAKLRSESHALAEGADHPHETTATSRAEARRSREDAQRIARAVRHLERNIHMRTCDVASMYRINSKVLSDAVVRARKAA